ncbi:trimeric intracellular cation channel family protein [Virgisporangium ochraceum]|uniref:trimeric intracellular cation channel family protein n=1 Tax=Virgisporangium ochraceum TaxID=65505 RepID=UPI001EF1E869|nr:trimeric intracellular cation channel family protein [Virgisporangium ochraceum]
MSVALVITMLELVGLFTFATSGALLAIQKGFDAVGILVLAILTALGGGILRDLIIGDTPPAAFTDVMYLVVPVVAAAVTFFAHPLLQRWTFTVLIFDAAGLGLFCVTGTLKALRFDLGPLQAVLLGVMTAVGGGVLRDITARETPALVQADSSLYAIPAALGSAGVVGAYHAGLPLGIVGTAAAVFVFGLRVVAMVRHWRAPRAWTRRRPEVGR